MTEAGMLVSEAIKPTTVNAKLHVISDKTGTIEKGKPADIIALDGGPMKDGIVNKNE